mmetsp:Transcript_3092/g.7092  ORF Transcript_3092/g.7092 Transcript_3092/m.7092 type:complete len:225 (+) Transcript_3092:231-905(+)
MARLTCWCFMASSTFLFAFSVSMSISFFFAGDSSSRSNSAFRFSYVSVTRACGSSASKSSAGFSFKKCMPTCAASFFSMSSATSIAATGLVTKSSIPAACMCASITFCALSASWAIFVCRIRSFTVFKDCALRSSTAFSTSSLVAFSAMCKYLAAVAASFFLSTMAFSDSLDTLVLSMYSRTPSLCRRVCCASVTSCSISFRFTLVIALICAGTGVSDFHFPLS